MWGTLGCYSARCGPECAFSSEARCGPPSITVSALSRDTSSGRVVNPLPSRHLASGFAFPLVEGFGVAFVFCSFDQGPLLESRGGKLVPPTIYPVPLLPIMIRCSNSPTFSGRQGSPNQPNDE